MSTAAPQILEGQPARLDVGTSLACRIIGFSHANVVLALGEQPEELAVGDLGYLLLESAGRVHALRGRIAVPPGDEVVLRLTDGIRLGQRRTFSRAPLAVPATLRLPDGDLGLRFEEWRATTVSCSPRSRSRTTATGSSL